VYLGCQLSRSTPSIGLYRCRGCEGPNVRRSDELLQQDVHAPEHLRHQEIAAGTIQCALLLLIPRRGSLLSEADGRRAGGRGVGALRDYPGDRAGGGRASHELTSRQHGRRRGSCELLHAVPMQLGGLRVARSGEASPWREVLMLGMANRYNFEVMIWKFGCTRPVEWSPRLQSSLFDWPELPVTASVAARCLWLPDGLGCGCALPEVFTKWKLVLGSRGHPHTRRGTWPPDSAMLQWPNPGCQAS
jgi:hypothetical protein